MDNATVHTATEMSKLLDKVLKVSGVNLKFLPKYSPELNPAEPCFLFLKQYLKHNKGNSPFWFEILHAVTKLTPEMMQGFYKHSIIDIFEHLQNLRHISTS